VECIAEEAKELQDDEDDEKENTIPPRELKKINAKQAKKLLGNEEVEGKENRMPSQELKKTKKRKLVKVRDSIILQSCELL